MAIRVEYLDFQNLSDHREFRFRIHGADAATNCGLRIPLASFGPRVRLQDGPEICYQKLLRTVVAGEAIPETIDIDEAEIVAYREAHTQAPRHKSFTRPTPASPAARTNLPRGPVRTFPARPVPPPAAEPAPPAFQEGQRVRHAIFGEGVTVAASSAGHTAVCFDQGGTKTFVTSILAVDVLSAPHAWETTARGVNRPRHVEPEEAPAD